MPPLRHICVFCGSSPGRRPEYAQSARALGAMLAARGQTLVYGGGNVGIMGILADAVLAGGGRVVGVIPEALKKHELAHAGLSELHVTRTMHERKALMAERADGFIALPGGLGTFEEFLEILTWAQLGIHAKPCGLLNVAGYYDPLVAFIEHAVAERFVKPVHRSNVLLDDDPAGLLRKMEQFTPAYVEKWLDADKE